MKKILVLMLILSVASLANAGVVVTLDKTEVFPGDVVTLVIGNDAGAAGGTIGFTLDVIQGAEPASAGVLGAWMLPPATAATITSDAAGVYFAFTNGTIGLNVMGDWLEASFTVNPGAAAGSFVDLNWGGAILGMTPENMSIPVVPEPTTIALLGLGGLALLRRRKK